MAASPSVADPTNSKSGCDSTIMRMPETNRAWSSTMAIRMGMSVGFLWACGCGCSAGGGCACACACAAGLDGSRLTQERNERGHDELGIGSVRRLGGEPSASQLRALLHAAHALPCSSIGCRCRTGRGNLGRVDRRGDDEMKPAAAQVERDARGLPGIAIAQRVRQALLNDPIGAELLGRRQRAPVALLAKP